MQITAVTKQKNGSYDIYVDGEKYQRLDGVVLASFRKIKVGTLRPIAFEVFYSNLFNHTNSTLSNLNSVYYNTALPIP